MISRPALLSPWGAIAVGGALVLLLAVLRACDRRDGGLNAELRQARATADSLRLVVRADSVRSSAVRDAADRTREPLRAAATRADSAGGRTGAQLARLRASQDAARRAVEDSLSGVVQLAENLRRLNEESSRLAIAYMAERDARTEEREAAARRIAALEAQTAADSAEKVDLYRDLRAREAQLAAQGKALRCKIGPFPCPSRLTSAVLGAGFTAAVLAAIAF